MRGGRADATRDPYRASPRNALAGTRGSREERVTVEADAAVARDAAPRIVMTNGRRRDRHRACARQPRPPHDRLRADGQFLVQAGPVVGAAAGRDFVAAVLTPRLDKRKRFFDLIETPTPAYRWPRLNDWQNAMDAAPP